MEQNEFQNQGHAQPAQDLLRRYHIYNPNLLVAPMYPGTDQLVSIDPENPYRRAREWQADQWPSGANVAISTGSQNHLVVLSVKSEQARKRLFAAAIDESGDLTPYMVRIPNAIHCYYRTRYDRTSVPVAPASMEMRGIEVISDGGYVPGAGSVIDGWQCKPLLDATLDIPSIPELPRQMADLLGLVAISDHPAYKPRMRML